jgi:hypothetical protein
MGTLMHLKKTLVLLVFILLFTGRTFGASPAPLLQKDYPVDWRFVFKFNGAAYPGCGDDAQRSCPFGGVVQSYTGAFGQQYVYASSSDPSLQKGKGCAGTTLADPLGASFDEVYNGAYFYVLWNDQFYGDPLKSRAAPSATRRGSSAGTTRGRGSSCRTPRRQPLHVPLPQKEEFGMAQTPSQNGRDRSPVEAGA